eukprot:scaffold80_cov325-Pavlova_lutheri.AAC.37
MVERSHTDLFTAAQITLIFLAGEEVDDARRRALAPVCVFGMKVPLLSQIVHSHHGRTYSQAHPSSLKMADRMKDRR